MEDYMNEKAIGLILLFASAILLLFFQGSLKEAYAENAAKQTCKISVKENSGFKLRYQDFTGKIKCPTVDVAIKNEGQNAAKEKIANAMFDCWDQFGRGRLDLFADDNIYCVICHNIKLNKGVKIEEFNKYLSENNAPHQKVSYLQFLTTESTSGSEFLKEYEKSKIQDSIDASKKDKYVVVFTYVKGKKELKEYAEKAKWASPGAGAMAVGFGVFKAGGVIGAAISASPATPAIGAPVGLAISGTGATIMAFGALWSGIAGYLVELPFEHIATISLVPYDAENLQALSCKELPLKQ